MNEELELDGELIDIPDDELMLSTIDNPYSPKKDYNKWRKWDIDNGYNTEALLDRIADIPEDVDDPSTISARITTAMMFIVTNDVLERYKLV